MPKLLIGKWHTASVNPCKDIKFDRIWSPSTDNVEH